MPEEQSDSLAEAIRENAEGPHAATNDGQSVRTHSLRDQIEAHRYQEALKAQKRRWLGLRFTVFDPPGGRV